MFLSVISRYSLKGSMLKNKIKKKYDIVVVGAGMTGAAIAIGLAKEGWNILLLDQSSTLPTSLNIQDEPALRISAINYTSWELLRALDISKSVLNFRAVPYKKLEIWESKNSHVIFEAKSIGFSELGYMIENDVLQVALLDTCLQYSNLTLLAPARVIGMTYYNKQWKITLNNNCQVLTNLIIGADGANSQVRSFAGIKSNIYQYSQSCMLITVRIEESQQDIAWQQFFPSGPRAFLPLFGHWASLVWYDTHLRIKQLQNMSFKELTKEIILSFPPRFKYIEVVKRGFFSLIRHHANSYVQDGVVLIGDAAHTINPLAGQGVNLGYRDVASLLKVLINAEKCLLPYYERATLLSYQKNRILDNVFMQLSMDLIYGIFCSQLPAAKFFRNFFLMSIQRTSFLKKEIIKYALGL
ncbi:FAD-dependent oxidoreductase [Arsenophonus symbiont of Ornithomya chloropus]|uniref:FAD-dependent oxidoreductase n=1 Tax=Arsenophonus symbiont of Ornithomya chloropus TaxID=634121 RepID=UPI003D6D15BD